MEDAVFIGKHGFNITMIFRFLVLVHVCASFQLKCPEPAQWSIRARSLCPDPSKYFCLKNDLFNGYSENCTVFDFLNPGRKNVLRGGLDADICAFERYQPIKFYTNASTNCIFLKSSCNEEGQVIFNKGNRIIDATCRCDYTRNYNFLFQPRNQCFCEPSKEDCSCYLTTCPRSTDRLSPDYKCLPKQKKETVSKCKAIKYERVKITRNKNTKEYILRNEYNLSGVQKKIILSCLITGLLLIFLILVNLDGWLDRNFWKVYFIYKPPSKLELIEGQTIILKYGLSDSSFAVSFWKDNKYIVETDSIKKSIVGRFKSLEFTNVAPSDAGTYYLKVVDMKSNLTELIVHPMFLSKINPQICIEGTKLQLTCSVYADNVEVKWYKEKLEIRNSNRFLITSRKNQRTLIIEKTTMMDSGTYIVKAGNVQLEIKLTVKDLFRRPLKDLTVMEGLDTLFNCETEEENCDVQWFINDKEIIHSTERIEVHQSQTRIHTLTIRQTDLNDIGKYSIRVKGHDSIVALDVKEMPDAIKQIYAHDREQFLKAAKSGKTIRHNIRVIIVGKNSAEKTCLFRRIMKKQIEDVHSTDGIDIERRKCQIDIRTCLYKQTESLFCCVML